MRRWPHGFSPLAASLIAWVVMWAWHVPDLQPAGRDAASVLWLQQASYLGVGFVLWLSVLGGERDRRYERVGTGIIALLLTSMQMTLLGVLSMIGDRPVYGQALDAAGGVDDQRLAGLLILSGAGVVYAIAGLMLLAWLLRPRTRLAGVRPTV